LHTTRPSFNPSLRRRRRGKRGLLGRAVAKIIRELLVHRCCVERAREVSPVFRLVPRGGYQAPGNDSVERSEQEGTGSESSRCLSPLRKRGLAPSLRGACPLFEKGDWLRVFEVPVPFVASPLKRSSGRVGRGRGERTRFLARLVWHGLSVAEPQGGLLPQPKAKGKRQKAKGKTGFVLAPWRTWKLRRYERSFLGLVAPSAERSSC